MDLRVFEHRGLWNFRLYGDGVTKASGRGFVSEETAREAAEIALVRLSGLPPREPSLKHVSRTTAGIIRDWVKREFEGVR